MQKPVLTHIEVGSFGCIDISIPILTLGSGTPILAIISGIHGNEISGLFVIEQFLKRLTTFKGQINIIPSAYPLTQSLKMRLSPHDFKDLNRVFPGNPDKTFPEQIAYQLMKFLRESQSNLVIDFHSFGLKNPIMAIYMHCGSPEVKQKSLQYINAFQPAMIWKLDCQEQIDIEYEAALGPSLASEGIPNFAVEMPQNYRMTEQEIQQACQGLERVMGTLGMLAYPENPAAEVPMYVKDEYYCSKSGLFSPLKNIMAAVKQGEVIAKITGIPSFQETLVTAPNEGILLQIHDRSFITTGTAIFAMGHLVEQKF
ncbi:succinylglutamate desuccinylase/aspartoacylase family protein [candidate division CSSED10-310 bacterium]|uniref:Succinylglutamate desuccinylase/aspartoacylase family protein n=1 Tax=candidate division CSSED10-310 bacterium TaxID=2855610 RepID=A0ABV6YVJ3_UNCC1